MPGDFVEEIFDAFAARGGDAYGERVSQLDHALQCAWLAQSEGADDALVAAALLHDYGHLFEGRGHTAEIGARDARHEVHGASALRRWFGPEVTGPIALHVAAKRYLCAAEPGYQDALSPASVLSLEQQGGPFAPAERRRFEARRFASDAVRLRRWDDAGKTAGLSRPGLEHYRSLLLRAAKSGAQTGSSDGT
ncbi:MAG TPA: HD domain-containing protein [Caulobacteraceae bacterium]|nr:HD domain-containing protein [Caulobacteraceae bacterium]